MRKRKMRKSRSGKDKGRTWMMMRRKSRKNSMKRKTKRGDG